MASSVPRVKLAAGYALLAVRSPRQFIRAVRFRHGPPRYRNLRRLVHRRRPATMVEVGVWRGESAEMMIRAAMQHRPTVRYWGFDLFSEGMTDEILKREVSLRPLAMAEVQTRLDALGAEVHLVAGDTTKTIAATELPPIDFAFIDGGHSYETVSADWSNLRERLSPGAIVLFDDYTNLASVEHLGYGVRRLIDELRRDYGVELLRPIDTFPHPWGDLEVQFAALTIPGSPQ